MDEKLNKLRNYIDTFDDLIKNLLVFRMSLMPLVSNIKHSNNLSIIQTSREKKIFEEIESFSNITGINEVFLKQIFRTIIDEAIRLENNFVVDKKEAKSGEKERDLLIDKAFKEIIYLKDIFNNLNPFEFPYQTKLVDELTEYFKEKLD